ncbi:MAG TPA: 2'-5' RNA ligase family protein, partial [Bryobacteraceae bacterium]|nr:2'-5' RNA ligase family protein [Bryobacteraceae bacterium]
MGCTEGPNINSFALVSYIPDPLGGFLDRLRTDLVCDCHAKAHVTVLPPRPLFCESAEAWVRMRERLQDIQPFEIQLGEIEIFPVTDVIYVSIASGYERLRELHASLDTGCLEFQEP